MAKNKQTPIDKLNAADKKHAINTEKYVNMVASLYRKAVDDLSELAVKMGGFSEGDTFSFASNPGIDKMVDEVISKLCGRITAVMERGNRAEWIAACEKSDQFIADVLKTSKLTKKTLQAYQDRNLESLAAFQERKVDGLGLSDRVWKHVAPLKDEVELAVDTNQKFYKNGIDSSKNLTKIERGIGSGISAAELSRDVRSCLKEPNKLFRRVRDKHGNLVLSKAAQLYHPGQGVYRSSYKNAMRMTRSEINMAYRQSDHMRWQQLDFVVGQRVSLSNNHTIENEKGERVRFHDICDELVGDYPKEAKLVGWHPQCKCVITPILKTLDEVDKDVDEDGNYTSLPSANHVYNMPQAFNDYIANNEERIKGWKSVPYYIRDNQQFVDKALHPERYAIQPLILLPDVFKQLSVFEMYGFNHQGSKLFNEALNKAKEAVQKGLQTDFDDAMAEMERIQKKNDASAASKAKKKQEINPEVLRRQKIQEAADKRHAERDTVAIKTQWDERRAKYEAIQANALDIASKASAFKDIDLARLVDIQTSGQYYKLEAEANAIEVRMDEIRAEVKKLVDLIPDAEALLKDYTIEELKSMHGAIDNKFKSLAKMTLTDQKQILEAEVANASNDIFRNAYQKKLDEVNIDIRLEYIKSGVLALANAANSRIKTFKDLYDKVKICINNRDADGAEDALGRAIAMQDAVKRYEDLYDYEYAKAGKGSAKIRGLLAEAETLLNNEDIASAAQKIMEGEQIKAKNEASAAAKKLAREQAKLQAQQQASAPAPTHKKVSEANYDELKVILGSDMPELLKKYEESVRRTQFTKKEYIKEQAEFNRKMKEMLEASNFSHCFKTSALEGYLDKGILNNLQAKELGIYDKGTGYNESRLSYGHFAFGLQDDNRTKVKAKDRMQSCKYYRCGVPVSKDPTEAYNQLSGYGECQLVLRKDNVVTTFVMDNSLGEETIPSLVTDPQVCSLDRKDLKHFGDSSYSLDTITESDSYWGGSYQYVELQYIPKDSKEYIGVEDFESITVPKSVLKSKPKDFWQKWADKGCTVMYQDTDGKVKVFIQGVSAIPPKYNETKAQRDARQKNAAERARLRHLDRDKKLKAKGLTAEEYQNQLIADRVAEHAKIREGALKLINAEARYVNKDVSFDTLKEKLNKGNYLGVREEAQRLKALVKQMEYEENKLKDLIVDVHEQHKNFTLKELQEAHAAIQSKVDYIDNNKKTLEEKLAGWESSVQRLNDAANRKRVTWEVEQKAYQRKVKEITNEIRRRDLTAKIVQMRKEKAADKNYNKFIDQAEALLKVDAFDAAELKIEYAAKILDEEKAKRSEGRIIKFDASAFTQERKDAAVWFKNEKNPQKSFNDADRYMSHYAEDLWGRISEEEKHVLYLYTSGSRYVNEPLMGRFYGNVKYGNPEIDSGVRHSVEDINTLTEVIDKAKPLENDMWVQHSESSSGFMQRFGLSRMPADLSKLVGMEAVNDPFMSTSCAKYSHFTKEDLVSGMDVVMSIYLPKGTKGVYCEPFAHWGDGKKTYSDTQTSRYQTDAVKWNGKSRQDEGRQASAQVEFLLQRGAKIRITNAELKGGRWFVECELIEQTIPQEFTNKALSIY